MRTDDRTDSRMIFFPSIRSCREARATARDSFACVSCAMRGESIYQWWSSILSHCWLCRGRYSYIHTFHTFHSLRTHRDKSNAMHENIQTKYSVIELECVWRFIHTYKHYLHLILNLLSYACSPMAVSVRLLVEHSTSVLSGSMETNRFLSGILFA
jgi:hypothetical protein